MPKHTLHLLAGLISAVLICASASAQQPAADSTLTSSTLTLRISPNTSPSEPIPIDEAREIYLNYRNKMKKELEKNRISFSNKKPRRKKQTKYIWFSNKDIMSFAAALNKFQAASKANDGIGAQEISGLRVYFGVYPREHREVKVSKNKLTIIVCATYNDGGVHRDIKSMRGDKNAVVAMIGGYENHGHLCPPGSNCPGAELEQ